MEAKLIELRTALEKVTESLAATADPSDSRAILTAFATRMRQIERELSAEIIADAKRAFEL